MLRVHGKKGLFFGLGLNVVVLGVVSLLTDVSTEMILPLFPIFTVEVLGASMMAFGLIEGLAESTASLLKVVSGWWSDRVGRRKPFIAAGYGMSTVVKPTLAVATSWPHALLVRFFDRVGKGLRTAPRDALIAESAGKKVRGKAFGLHRALDTTGAVIGPALAFLLFPLLGYGGIFLIAAIPALVAVAVIVFFVRETKKKRPPPKQGTRPFNREFKLYLMITALFALGNFSWAFFILAAVGLGISAVNTILFYILYNIVYAGVSLPAGILSDRIGRRPVIAFGFATFGVTCVGFALAGSAWQAILLFVLYGAFKGLTEGVQKAYVADLVVPRLRGTAMGALDTAVGLAAFPASFIAGAIWYGVGAWATFVYGAALSFAAMFMILALKSKKNVM